MYTNPVAGVGAGQRAQRHHSRHEAQIGVRFAGRDKLVHLIGLGEVVARLGRGFAERLHRAVHTREGITDRNQLAALTLHGSFSHAPQTRQGFAYEEFMSQYGGINQAADRYKELLTLPEAEVPKGISIDDYSTFRATRFSEAG